MTKKRHNILKHADLVATIRSIKKDLNKEYLNWDKEFGNDGLSNIEKVCMPFKSKKQMKWMFANEPEMAKKWADETKNPKSLPEKKKKKRSPLSTNLKKK